MFKKIALIIQTFVEVGLYLNCSGEFLFLFLIPFVNFTFNTYIFIYLLFTLH